MSPARAVAITGLDVVAWPGHGVDAVWDALAAGRRPAGASATVPEPWLRHQVPAELESQAKFLNGASQLAAHAITTAVLAARLDDAGLPDDRKGFFAAQVDPTVIDFAAYRPAMADATDGFRRAPDLEQLNAASVRKMNPFYLLETLNNNAFSLVSAWHGLRGANTSVSGWRTPGLAVVGAAARAVARGDATAAVAYGAGRNGGPVTTMELARLGVLPAGTVGGDAAGAFVLETLDAATARGASPVAIVRGAATGSAGRGSLAAAVRATAVAACGEAGLAVDAVGSVHGDTQATLDAVGAGDRGRLWRTALGEAGPGGDAADLVLAATAVARGRRPDGTPAGTTALVVAAGFDGQVAAVLLGRAG
ncbi:MAG: hypothetical protein JNM10_09200 [Planctomycetia bacterium]|nr:hypothetical protein [Planctomycetia bacterium]